MPAKWPKQLPPLTSEQMEIKKDFMKFWHEELPKRYGLIEKFNHGYPVKHSRAGGSASSAGKRALEIGAGLGEHIYHEDLTNTEYHALEILPSMAAVIKKRFPSVQVVVGDCQKHVPFPDRHFDRVIAIHVLEHLPNLPAALREIRRVLKPDGEFYIVIPCEGGWAYSIARRISAKRLFEKRYKVSYDWCIKSEHVNTAKEILEELPQQFRLVERSFFPWHIPSIEFNLVIGLMLQPLS